MTDIPDDAIFRCIEHMMQCDGELDDAEARAQVAARDRHGVDHFGAQFVGDLAQIAFGEGAQIGRAVHPVKQWGRGFAGQRSPRPARA